MILRDYCLIIRRRREFCRQLMRLFARRIIIVLGRNFRHDQELAEGMELTQFPGARLRVAPASRAGRFMRIEETVDSHRT